MFFLGLELDLEQIKRTWKTTIPIACASILVPGKYPHFFLKKRISSISVSSGYWLCCSCMVL